MDRSEAQRRVAAAFAPLQAAYFERGGWKYPGFLTEADGYSYPGPLAWSEADFQYRFAKLLETEFPDCAVYLELPLRARTRPDLSLLPGAKGSTHIDIVVTDLSGVVADDPAREGTAFRTRCHEAFIEVKWFLKSYERWKFHHCRSFRKGVPADLERLSAHQGAGRCLAAALLLVIDAPWVMPLVHELEVPKSVDLLLLEGPSTY
jgi:hypothetical protein